MRISNIKDFKVGKEYTMTLNNVLYVLRCTQIVLPQVGTYTVFFGYENQIRVDRHNLKNFCLEEVV